MAGEQLPIDALDKNMGTLVDTWSEKMPFLESIVDDEGSGWFDRNVSGGGEEPGTQVEGAWGSSSYSTGVNGTAKLTTDEFLAMMLGPKQVATSVLIPITIIYVLMFVTGVIGNVAVCVVIIRNRTMHTATNYYLFSLAISDLIILLLGLPNELAGFWHQYPYIQGEIFCKFRSFVSEMASYASVLTIVSFSVERYLAICHPLHVFLLGDFQRVLRVVSVDWIVAGLAAVPYLLFTRINYVDYPLGTGHYLDESAFCALLDINITPKGYPMHELATILFFIIPVGILLFLYISMAVTLAQSMNGVGQSGSVHGERHVNSSRKQIIRMLAVVVIAFFLCWAPFHAQRLGYVYFKESHVFRIINEYLMYVSGITYYVSSTINPILYNVMSAKYRAAFRRTLCGVPTNGGGLPGHQLSVANGGRLRVNTWDSDGGNNASNTVQHFRSARFGSSGKNAHPVLKKTVSSPTAQKHKFLSKGLSVDVYGAEAPAAAPAAAGANRKHVPLKQQTSNESNKTTMSPCAEVMDTEAAALMNGKHTNKQQLYNSDRKTKTVARRATSPSFIPLSVEMTSVNEDLHMSSSIQHHPQSMIATFIQRQKKHYNGNSTAV